MLTLVAEASDVELGARRRGRGPRAAGVLHGSARNPLEQIYDLKREIAEARRALGPVTAVLPELMAEAEEGPRPPRARSRGCAEPRRGSSGSTSTSTGYDGLLSDMLSVHLSQVSVRQNEDMRKISAWAAIAAAPTLVAGIYGMNFEHMPELAWTCGLPVALVAMGGVCSRCTGLPAVRLALSAYVVTGAPLASSTPVSSSTTTSAASPRR